MKKICFIPRFTKCLIIVFAGVTLSSGCYAQYSRFDSAKKVGPKLNPNAYLGFGIGLGNYCGIIGLGASARIVKPLYLRVGIGIGSWGYKMSVTLLYKEKEFNGWAIGVGYSYCTGLTNFSTSLQTVDSSGNTVTKNVSMNLLPASTLNLTATYEWYYHKKNYFYLEFGYSILLTVPTPYQITDGSVLTSTSQDAIQLDAPGGLVLGVGLMFGLSQ